jgi:DNA (cytosine-5)-methyltransferase 1
MSAVRARLAMEAAIPRIAWDRNDPRREPKQLTLPGVGGRVRGLILDYFAGGGGASCGIERAVGRPPDYAVNHCKHAIEQHKANHPNTHHLLESVWKVDPASLSPDEPVWLAWFSPDCRHFSRAKGKKPVSKKIRGLAWVVPRVAGARRPTVFMLENVSEFLTWGPLRKGKPIKRLAGKTFAKWKRQIERLGYRLEYRVLDAADFGAPTHRRRLVIIARCDGEPIVWPTPTHGPGRAHPWRITLDQLDLTDLGNDIFTRKKPLAKASKRRIAVGLLRFALSGHIVTLNHSGDEFRGQSVVEPFRTITAARDAHGLVVPQIMRIGQTGGGDGGKISGVDVPLSTITSKAEHCVTSLWLVKNYTGVVGHGVAQPLGTITAKDHHYLGLAHLTKLYGTSIGAPVSEPCPTITGQGQHLGLVSCVVKYYGTGGQHQGVAEPLHTVTAKSRFGVVTAELSPQVEQMITPDTRRVARFLLDNLKIRKLRKVDREAGRRLLAQARRGIVTVQIDGELFAVVGITMRMLTPRELARCQGFDEDYQLIGTKAEQIARIGNSVPPPLAEAVVRANLPAALRAPRRDQVRRAA